MANGITAKHLLKRVHDGVGNHLPVVSKNAFDKIEAHLVPAVTPIPIENIPDTMRWNRVEEGRGRFTV